MESLRVRSGKAAPGLALLLITGSLAACAGTATPTGPGSSVATLPSAAPTAAASGTPAPTALAAVEIAGLPQAPVDMKAVKISCDAAVFGAGASMSCEEILQLSARIAATTSINPIKQLAVAKSADNPDAIDVTFWVLAEAGKSDTAFTSTIDPAAQLVTIPLEDAKAVFPR